jgi:hypothetical protein
MVSFFKIDSKLVSFKPFIYTSENNITIIILLYYYNDIDMFALGSQSDNILKSTHSISADVSFSRVYFEPNMERNSLK